MLNILARYITRTVVFATGMTAIIILSLLSLMLLLGEIKNIGDGDYNFNKALFYVLLSLPNALYQFSPMLILLGSIIGLSILSSHRELAIMRVSGLSVTKIIMHILGGSLLLILLLSLLGELVGPHLSYKAEINKENAKNEGQAVATSSGVWMHVQDNFIHVEHVVGKQLLEGVTRYQFDNQHHLQAAYFAKKLAYESNHWKMFDVVKTIFYKDRTVSESFLKTDWNLAFNANLLNGGIVGPKQMSLSKLSQFAHYLKKNGLQATEYQFEFWQRLFQPFASLVMIFLAVPFVLSTLSTTTMGWRIVAGILTGFGFYILNAFLGQLCIVYQIPPIMAASLPPIFFATFGLYLANQIIKQ